MTTLVFTFACQLLQCLLQSFCTDMLLYLIMWISVVIQATFAYIRISKTKQTVYPITALILDGLDLGIGLFICAIIAGRCNEYEYQPLNSYLLLSIPFLLYSICQFLWFIVVRKFDIPALFRITILGSGMLTISILELFAHNSWSLLTISILLVLLGILRIINKAPILFSKFVTKLWEQIKTIKQ